MAVSVTSTPVSVPTGIRVTTGVITFDSSYLANGETITAAQFGGGSNGIPNRLPDFVVFNPISKAGGAGTAAAGIFAYDKTNGLVHQYSHTLSDNAGLAEMQSTTDASTQKAGYLAVWVSADPAGFTTV